MKTNRKLTLKEAINWEWVHAHHARADGKVKAGVFADRVMWNAQRNGYPRSVSVRGLLRVINANLY